MKSFNDFMKEAWQEGAGKAKLSEKELSPKQKKIAAVAGDKDKIDAADLATLRAGKKPVDEASCDSKYMKKEELVGKQHKLDKNKNGKLDAHDFKLLRKEEAEELDEGRVKELAMDLKDMSHDEFHKQYGKPKSHFDPTNFKKPVEPGKGMDRAKALAQRGMQSLSKEEVERIEEKLTQIDELSKNTLGSYVKKASSDLNKTASAAGSLRSKNDSNAENTTMAADKRESGIKKAATKLAKEEVEQIDEISKKTLGSYVKGAAKDVADRQERIRAGARPNPGESQADFQKDMSKALALQSKRKAGMNKAVDKLTKEEVEQEMSPYLKATLAVMDEGKIDNLRDAQALRNANKSAFDKDYKQDNTHPSITLVKGNKYGGSNQNDNEGDEKPEDEKQEKKGRGRPAGSKSGARQKGNGHEDGGIPVHNLHLPNRNK